MAALIFLLAILLANAAGCTVDQAVYGLVYSKQLNLNVTWSSACLAAPMVRYNYSSQINNLQAKIVDGRFEAIIEGVNGKTLTVQYGSEQQWR